MSLFAPIRKLEPTSQKPFYMLEDVLNLLGVTKNFWVDQIPAKAQAWLTQNGMDARKVLRSGIGDWMVTEVALVGVVACILPVHGDREMINAAKVELGLIDPPPTPPALALSRREEPVASVPQSNALAVFSYGASQVRTQMINGEPWFCLKDAAAVLGIRNHKHFLSSEWCNEDGVRQMSLTDSLGRNQSATFLNEPNLYALILRSDKKEAVAFQRWITHEVIPSIRKTGSYSATPSPVLPQDYKSALVALLAEVEKSEQQQAVILELTPKAEFHDKVADATNCHTFQEAGKILGIGQNRLFRHCYDNGILMKKSRLPYQRFNDSGYFRIIEEVYTHQKSGEQRVSYKTLITGKGMTYLERSLSELKIAS